MQGVRTYLESSTIHGLSYISTTRKCSRIFWVVIVIAGFSLAGELIYDAFQSWALSPISTSEQTLQMEQIKFPKVTVCPPKNTFTDLNYDLMQSENIEDFDRAQLKDFIFDFIDNHVFMDDLNKLQEDKRFYNWYYGYSQLTIRSKEMNNWVVGSVSDLQYRIDTSAKSGVIFTQYWGEPYNARLVEKSISYRVIIKPPKNTLNLETLVFHYQIEIVSLRGLMRVSQDKYEINRNIIEEDLTFITNNITSPVGDFIFDVNRNVEKENLNDQTLSTMPGFKLTWWFTGAETNLKEEFGDDERSFTLDFIRLNLIIFIL